MSNTISSKQSKPQTLVFVVVLYVLERDRIKRNYCPDNTNLIIFIPVSGASQADVLIELHNVSLERLRGRLLSLKRSLT